MTAGHHDFLVCSDGDQPATGRIQLAIDQAHNSGGGTVTLAPGLHQSGTVMLKSNVTLRLETGAVLKGSDNIDDYDPPHLVFARDAERIGIVGPGTIDGNLPAFVNHTGEPPPEFKPERRGWGYVASMWCSRPERHPRQMVELVNCRDVRIQDVTLANSPLWTLHLVACERAFIRGVSIRNPIWAPEGDGIDITACQDVVISDCIVHAGDDAICLKNGGDYGLLRACRNIVVTNCSLTTSCNGFKIGTESRADFENITFSNSVVSGPPGPPHERPLAGIALESVDGGSLSGIIVSNIAMTNARCALFIRLGSRGNGQASPKPGSLRDVLIDNVCARNVTIPCVISGIPGHDVEHVTLSNLRLLAEGGEPAELVDRPVPERPANYPECTMFGKLPAYGLYCRHIRDLRLRNIDIRLGFPDPRPPAVFDDVRELSSDLSA